MKIISTNRLVLLGFWFENSALTCSLIQEDRWYGKQDNREASSLELIIRVTWIELNSVSGIMSCSA